jgi:hypothetical protein
VDTATRYAVGRLVAGDKTARDTAAFVDHVAERPLASAPSSPACSATFILSGVLMEPVGFGRPRRFVGDRRSSVTAAIAIGAAVPTPCPLTAVADGAHAGEEPALLGTW